MRSRFAMALIVAVLALLAIPSSAQAYDFSMDVGVVQAHSFMYTTNMERVTPLDVVTLDGDMITVYCTGWRESWRCQNYSQMQFIHIDGNVESDWVLTPGPAVVPLALVVLNVYKN